MARYDDLQFTTFVTPASPEVAAEERAEAETAKTTSLSDALVGGMNLPEMEDPFAWGTMKPSQSLTERTSELARIASNRRSRATAQKDAAALGPGPDPFDAEAQQKYEAASRDASQRLQRDVQTKATGQRQTEPPKDTSEATQRATRYGEAQQRASRRQSSGSLPEYPTFAEPPSPGSPMVSGGQEYGDQPQQSFAKAQAEHNMATERLLTAFAQAIADSSRRIEELYRIVETRQWE